MNMGPDLCIGISSKNEVLELAALERGRSAVTATFPATGIGLEAIKVFLAGSASPVRLAVAGVAALSVALALGNSLQREVFIVSAATADQPLALAQYAMRSS
ncbi:MAG: hypothetical protein WC540_01925 [Sulfuritalea sp.]